VAEAAAHFGVTETELRRDLELLFLCGLPPYGYLELIDIDVEPGPDGDTITIVAAQGLDRPLRLTGGEAVALRVAAQALADVPGLERNDALERAVKKLSEATSEADGPADLPVSMDLGGLRVDGQLLATVRAALDARTRLRIRYRNDARDEVTERDVDPHRLHLRESWFYLEGWCYRAQAVRLFRLDRIEMAQETGEPVDPAHESEVLDLDNGVFTSTAQDVRVVLELEPEARWVVDYYPVEAVDPLDPEGLRLRAVLRLGSEDYARRLLLRLGPLARLIEPAQLAAAVRATAEQALALYGA
jgi:proteasome accessory factor C